MDLRVVMRKDALVNDKPGDISKGAVGFTLGPGVEHDVEPIEIDGLAKDEVAVEREVSLLSGRGPMPFILRTCSELKDPHFALPLPVDPGVPQGRITSR